MTDIDIPNFKDKWKMKPILRHLYQRWVKGVSEGKQEYRTISCW